LTVTSLTEIVVILLFMSEPLVCKVWQTKNLYVVYIEKLENRNSQIFDYNIGESSRRHLLLNLLIDHSFEQ
jgi:hypothetical protein